MCLIANAFGVSVKLPSEQPTPVEEKASPPAAKPQVTMRPSVTVTSSVTVIEDKSPEPPASQPPPEEDGEEEENGHDHDGEMVIIYTGLCACHL